MKTTEDTRYSNNINRKISSDDSLSLKQRNKIHAKNRPPLADISNALKTDGKSTEFQSECKVSSSDSIVNSSQNHSELTCSVIDSLYIFDNDRQVTQKTESKDNISLEEDEYRKNEFKHMTSWNYMERQHEINEKMRTILIDWIIEVHSELKLDREILFLTVNIIDRFLERQNVSKKKLQMVGSVALFIASKYEQSSSVSIKQLVHLCDYIYSKEEMLQAERHILCTLNFYVTVCTSNGFLAFLFAQYECDTLVQYLSYYLAEITLLHICMLKYLPSLVAFSCLYLALKLIKPSEDKWDIKLESMTRYKPSDFTECINDIRTIVNFQRAQMKKKVEEQRCVFVTKKYSSKQFFEVAKILLDNQSW
jgi:hypothetical protein